MNQSKQQFKKAISEYLNTMKNLNIDKRIYTGYPFTLLWFFNISIRPPLFLNIIFLTFLRISLLLIILIIFSIAYFFLFLKNPSHITMPIGAIITWTIILPFTTGSIYFYTKKTQNQFSREIEEAKKLYYETINK
ncbi:MAG: hypothetical protein HQK51_03675 [Oligoflexia bacterium]|nr:hypothetical protein [Oligoflexia bacterium]